MFQEQKALLNSDPEGMKHVPDLIFLFLSK